ncbi:MAG TPA: hypothetical protein PKY86_06610 [Niabella sp.]|nr:hypothetical protein [Niabella sp.]HQW15465.1 hypothetical protein [Niabella sp.]HQX20607.1 hypothetical protein [Niabella sp.]HRB07011.1 hypothetical protein [Niabella sp.]HRB35817.1 hypothetical protein [Niabella sp.]
MKKIIVLFYLVFVAQVSFCQKEKNGEIYIKHPYIDVVMKATSDYLANDFSRTYEYYADTAKWWVSGLEDLIPIAEAVNLWQGDFEKFTDINQIQQGYPDFLHYKKDNAMFVQSWWIWSGKSKKTGNEIKIPIVIFNEFNTAGKISRELIYGDFSKME